MSIIFKIKYMALKKPSFTAELFLRKWTFVVRYANITNLVNYYKSEAVHSYLT